MPPNITEIEKIAAFLRSPQAQDRLKEYASKYSLGLLDGLFSAVVSNTGAGSPRSSTYSQKQDKENSATQRLLDSCLNVTGAMPVPDEALKELEQYDRQSQIINNAKFYGSFQNYLKQVTESFCPLFFDEKGKLHPHLQAAINSDSKNSTLITDELNKQILLAYVSAHVTAVLNNSVQDGKLATSGKLPLMQALFNFKTDFDVAQFATLREKAGTKQKIQNEKADLSTTVEPMLQTLNEQIEVYERLEKWDASEDSSINLFIGASRKIAQNIRGYLQALNKNTVSDANLITKTKLIVLSEFITVARFELAATENILESVEITKDNEKEKVWGVPEKLADDSPFVNFYAVLKQQQDEIKNSITVLENLEKNSGDKNSAPTDDTNPVPTAATYIDKIGEAYTNANNAVKQQLDWFQKLLHFFGIKSSAEQALAAAQAPIQQLKPR